MNLPPAILLLGATATGKSSLALALAARFPLEIVNLDASQLYCGMDIGTAKPTREEMAATPHHLFDVAAPDEPLNAGRYVALADRVAREILARGRLPLFVGGTGLYARALVRGLATIPEIAEELRLELETELMQLGAAEMHAELAQVDPESADRIGATDPQRITRALEVFRQTGRPISDFQREHRFARPRYEVCMLGLQLPRQKLDERIYQRVPLMFEAGFVEEVRRLLSRGFGPELRTFKALGYREVARYVAGEITREEALYRVTRSHRQYSRRQQTWFRKEPDIEWFAPSDEAGVVARVEAFCKTHAPTSCPA